MSLAVTVVLVGGIASAMVIATRALPSSESPIDDLVSGEDAVEQIAGELNYALSFTQRTANTVEFTVPDRNSDATAETIRYAWSGTAGDPLTRQYNGGTAVTVADNVHEFSLSYGVHTLTRQETQQVTNDSGEVTLASFDGWPGVSASIQSTSLSATSWSSEYFRISLPAGTTQARIMRVSLKLQSATGGGPTMSVGIHRPATPGGPVPASAPLGTPAVLPSSTLPAAFDWKDATFTDVVIDNPATSEEFCIVAKGTSPTSAYIRYLYSTAAPADVPVMQWTTNSGGSWAPTTNRHQQDLYFYVYGSYQSLTTQELNVSRYFVGNVGITLRVGADASVRVSTAVPVLNAPEVTGP